jgi:GMP synthase-like glutamine amidotransferase
VRIHVIRHVSFEGPGNIAAWALERGHHLSESDQSKGQALPAVDSFDLLVLMGGPMSVNDETAFGWLKPEKELVRQTLAAGKKILGVCLGAQMIASALGARVYPNALKEIGWFPLEATTMGKAHPLLAGLPAVLNAFHWHGETYDLPQGVSHLYRSSVCENQVYALGVQVLALQCHVEVTFESMQAMIDHGRDELDLQKPFIQAEAAMLAQQEKLGLLKPLVFQLLDHFVSLN